MKIRNGFVSNSSSSSFLIYGICVESLEDLIISKKLLNMIKENKENYNLKNIKKMINMYNNGEEADYDDPDSEDPQDFVNSMFEDMGLHIERPYDDSSIYIGRDFKTIGDEETGKQFKDSVEKDIKVLFGKNSKCEILEEAWMG